MPDTNNSETVLIAENVSTAALTPGYPLQHKLAVQSHSNSTDPSGCYSGTGEEGKYVSGFEKRAHFAQRPNFCF